MRMALQTAPGHLKTGQKCHAHLVEAQDCTEMVQEHSDASSDTQHRCAGHWNDLNVPENASEIIRKLKRLENVILTWL